jgi:hypothetical protein
MSLFLFFNGHMEFADDLVVWHKQIEGAFHNNGRFSNFFFSFQKCAKIGEKAVQI